MRVIIACLFGLGIISGVKAQSAQTDENNLKDTCYYRDENHWVCDMVQDQQPSGDVYYKGNFPQQEKQFSPMQEGTTKEGNAVDSIGGGYMRIDSSAESRGDKYLQPEKESDTGVLGEDGLYGRPEDRESEGQVRNDSIYYNPSRKENQ